MKQDRRLNGWVLIASILGIIAGIVLFGGGAALGILGFVKPEQISKIDEVVFFLNQEGFIELQLKLFNNELLKIEFLYLFAGIIVGVIGLTTLIFALVGLSYAKKRKVVRRKLALFIFTLIPAAIAGCAATYLVLEKEIFEFDIDFINNIKYVCYGLIGIFGVISLFNIMGILFGRSEKFMSNDNGKYAFDNSNLRGARANVNNGGVQARPAQQMTNSQQGQQVRRPVPNQSVPRPTSQGQQMQRPMQAGQPVQRPQATRPMQGQVSRPVSQQPRPQNPGQPTQIRRPVVRRCPKCGKVLNQGERFCSGCGYKIIN